MAKKFLMFLLVLFFCLGFLVLILSGKKKNAPPSVSLPIPTVEPSPVATQSGQSVPNQAIFDVENDLRMIEADLKKIKEDTRLTPPEFIFVLGI